MKIGSFIGNSLGVCALALALAACGGIVTQPNLAPPGEMPTLRLGAGAVTVHTNHRPSWMSPAAKASSLLYVTDSGTNTVLTYSYPALQPIGTLTGFNNPQGECVDKAGDVWIANTEASQVVEYAHGGTTPIATLSDPGQYPVGCAVDPGSGNLAVSNIYSTSGPPGSVSIFKHAAGTPSVYTPPGFSNVYFLGYDSKGTLYFDGLDSASAVLFASFKAKTFTDITLSRAIGGPGAVQVVGKDVVIGDQTIGANVAYTFAIDGSTGTLKSTTPLTGANDIVQFYVQKKRLVGGDFNPNGNSTVDLFKYPLGGSSIKTTPGVVAPIGAAVSE